MGWLRGINIKSSRELTIMREAGKINARALLAAVQTARPGATTAQVNAAAADVIHSFNAEPAFLGYPGPYPYPAETTISVNEELVHGIPGPRVLVEGDIVSIDCGTVFEGFVADSALTVAIGEVSEEAQTLMEVTLGSLYAGIQEMVAGNKTGDVSAGIQNFVEKNGYQVVREYTGHGVGANMHEDPQVPNYGTAGRGVVLRKGMTIALEPMVLLEDPGTRVLEDQWTVASRNGRITAHYEHTVAVTENGPRVLTALEEDLDLGEAIRYNQYFAGRG
ncbi:MAG: type I methionyl aminopeptidase [Anaerolineales bacterium]|nr:type I methionyl aminopeptidase [Anaerolineales bacterium]